MQTRLFASLPLFMRFFVPALVLLFLLSMAMGCQQRAPAAPMAPAPAPSTTYEYPEQYVTAYRLNVREGPSTEYQILAVLKRGESVQILDRVNDWLKVRRPPHVYEGGFVEGWVYGGYITGYEDEIRMRHKWGEGKPWG